MTDISGEQARIRLLRDSLSWMGRFDTAPTRTWVAAEGVLVPEAPDPEAPDPEARDRLAGTDAESTQHTRSRSTDAG